jgi:cytochrome o ubiquinol oxidase subunit 3
MTITNSMLGTTFYTLTGTHGTHVAIGVLWLILMYVRSFQPPESGRNAAWFIRHAVHIVVIVGAILLAIFATLALVHTLHTGGSIGAFFGGHFAMLAGLLACIAAGIYLARPTGPVNFGEANAIDVESMGLYWHFVDIVWIVIFTAVYLLEYL